MNCPYCNHEMRFVDEYYQGRPGKVVNGSSPHPMGYYSEASSDFLVLGQIYKCKNHEGFESPEEAHEYDQVQTHTGHPGDWEEIVCASADSNGFFYTDLRGDLHDGYPC